MEIVHVLKENGHAAPPFADFTLCGVKVNEQTSAMWPGEPLRGVHWGKPYRINGRWCARCKKPTP
jgi:hypothetical protein